MGMESLIPAGIGLVGSLLKGGGGGQQQAQQQNQQQMAQPFPQNPFPENHPDGGVRPPSILDIMRLIGGQGQMPCAPSDTLGSVQPGRPPSILDSFDMQGYR